ncbi:putative ABC transport system permease protein [Chitinophaga costaii]|uniref:Putative ABC transport system permease protein n=1 Tax=Chitinophaga costaii TaxID=1335309 RepID=A0A1C4DHT2_9BACT|nr:ABC transporter permease [Chitinophaga costaii]PUZ24642.1 macrolide ABC transporter permease [Chitinophaga costaii]SCC30949.1 putative ABC transport system permease protein [Chitinophaga costaii]
MFTNYLKIALRNLLRNKLFSAINVFGLAIGMTCCMLLLLYIRSEMQYDRHQQYAKDLYFLKSKNLLNNAGNKENATISGAYAGALKASFPEIEAVTRVFANVIEGKTLFQTRIAGKPLQSFYETRGYQVDTSFFQLFTYQFTEGSAATALQDPNAVVLSDVLAHKFFGNQPALHQLLTIGGSTGLDETFTVTGVYKDESARSHIDALFFVPMGKGWVGNFLRERPLNFSFNNMFFTYLRLRPGTDYKALERKFPAFMERYANKELQAAGYARSISLLPVTSIHLYDRLPQVVTSTSSRSYLYILGSIAVFTLLIACINFMNLATARATRRAAEVGIRKVMGAGRGGLIRQFLGESMVLCLLALVVAVAMVAGLLPLFNQLTGKTFTITNLLDVRMAAAFGLLALATGLLAGSYPAFYLSVFNPIQVLKGRFNNSMSATTLRRALVVFQFVISICLVLATLVIRQQMRYLRERPLGFRKDQQIVIPLHSRESRRQYATLHNQLLQSHLATGAAGTDYYPGILNPAGFGVHKVEDPVSEVQQIKASAIAPDYLQLMGFTLLKGRLFSETFPADTNNRMVVNEATLRKLNIPLEKAIGQRLQWDAPGVPPAVYQIIGVVRDFHFEDLHHAIQPYGFLRGREQDFNYLIVHVPAGRVDKTLAWVNQQWRSVLPNEPFEYSFLDQDFQRNYRAEQQTAAIVSTFTGISIFISCLGLFGLAAFAAQQRVREIGIRKILGASVINITALLSGDFLKLVLIALLIASPLAYWCMHAWLYDFAYRVEINGWIFLLAGFIAIFIALLTVSAQAIRAALINPVKSLKGE